MRTTIVENKKSIMTSISLPGDSATKAECEVVWGKFSNNRNIYNMGLQILTINSQRRHIWDSFIKELSQELIPQPTLR
jgi:uncharacterized Zn finger protein